MLLFIFALSDPTGITAIFPFSVLCLLLQCTCADSAAVVLFLPLGFSERCLLQCFPLLKEIRIVASGAVEAHRRHRLSFCPNRLNVRNIPMAAVRCLKFVSSSFEFLL